MSTVDGEDFGTMCDIGCRFREERERLGFSQRALATRIATTPKTLISYEAGETPPKLTKLILFAGCGADLNYILAGQRSVPSADDEKPAYTPAEQLAKRIAGMQLDARTAEALLDMITKYVKFHPDEKGRAQGYFDALSKNW